MNQSAWLLLLTYGIVVVYIFYICIKIVDYFDLQHVALPDNKLSRKTRRQSSLILIMLITSSAYLYYYNQIEPTSIAKTVVILSFVIYCYIPYQFALDLIPLKDEAIRMGSDLDRHDQNQTRLHKVTQGLIEIRIQELLKKNDILINRLNNEIFSKEDGKKIIETLIQNSKEIVSAINSEKVNLVQELTGLKKHISNLHNQIKDSEKDLGSSLEVMQKYFNQLSSHNRDYTKELYNVRNYLSKQLSFSANMIDGIEGLTRMLKTKNQYLIEENKISTVYNSASEAREFINLNKEFFEFDQDNFVSLLLGEFTSKADIIYIKENSRKNGVDKTYFLKSLLPQMFSINWKEITTTELQDFISSNFLYKEKEYAGINKIKTTTNSLTITKTTLNKYLKNHKAF